MMRTIAIMNNKGGVGKTVTAINLADILTRDYGQRVLLMDCDGQMTLTRFYLPNFRPTAQYTMVSLLLRDSAPELWRNGLMPITSGLDLIPGDPVLYDLDRRALQTGQGDAGRIPEFVDAVRNSGEVDFVLFDCPPGFTLASVGALMAADEVVVPVLADGFSVYGMDDLRTQLASLRRVKRGVRIAGLLLNQWHRAEVVQAVEGLFRQLPVPVFDTVIRRTDKVAESTLDLRPVTQYSPRSAASQDFRRWVDEYLGEVLPHGET